MSGKEGIENLTKQQRKFCENMALGNKKGESYLMAYPKCSKGAAPSNATKLLKMPKIKDYIKSLNEKALESCGVTNTRLIRELACIAFVNMDDFRLDWNSLIEFEKISRKNKAAIKKIKYKKNDTDHGCFEEIELELFDKMGALRELKELSGLKPKEEGSGDGVNITVNYAGVEPKKWEPPKDEQI